MTTYRTIERHLDSFQPVSTPTDLLTCEEDSILPLEGVTRDCKPPLHILGTRPYIACLVNARLIPATDLASALANRETEINLTWPSDSRLPEGVEHSGDANLLLNQAGEFVIPDSFYLKNLVHPAVNFEKSGVWQLPDIAMEHKLEGPCFYLEFVDAHFGHALVDTPARLWALKEFGGELCDQFEYVAFPRFGIKGHPGNWPSWVSRLLNSYGIDPERIRLIERPTRVRRLLVPRRITPWRHRGGIAYNDLMRRAGNVLAHPRTSSETTHRRLFLSRSRMKRRPQGDECNRRLEALFEAAGFEILHPQESTLEEQIRCVRAASHIAGCVGSQMHLIAFANQAELDVFRIAPTCFNPAIDGNIAAPVGYRIADFVLQREIDTGHLQDTTPWSLEEDDFVRLESCLANWLVTTAQ